MTTLLVALNSCILCAFCCCWRRNSCIAATRWFDGWFLLIWRRRFLWKRSQFWCDEKRLTLSDHKFTPEKLLVMVGISEVLTMSVAPLLAWLSQIQTCKQISPRALDRRYGDLLTHGSVDEPPTRGVWHGPWVEICTEKGMSTWAKRTWRFRGFGDMQVRMLRSLRQQRG